jgi:hypothetical protein
MRKVCSTTQLRGWGEVGLPGFPRLFSWSVPSACVLSLLVELFPTFHLVMSGVGGRERWRQGSGSVYAGRRHAERKQAFTRPSRPVMTW